MITISELPYSYCIILTPWIGRTRECGLRLAILWDFGATTISRFFRKLAADLLQIAQRVDFYSIIACGLTAAAKAVIPGCFPRLLSGPEAMAKAIAVSSLRRPGYRNPFSRGRWSFRAPPSGRPRNDHRGVEGERWHRVGEAGSAAQHGFDPVGLTPL